MANIELNEKQEDLLNKKISEIAKSVAEKDFWATAVNNYEAKNAYIKPDYDVVDKEQKAEYANRVLEAVDDIIYDLNKIDEFKNLDIKTWVNDNLDQITEHFYDVYTEEVTWLKYESNYAYNPLIILQQEVEQKTVNLGK